MRALQEYNMKLVGNILPMHVAEHFLKTQMRKDEVENYAFQNLVMTSELRPVELRLKCIKEGATWRLLYHALSCQSSKLHTSVLNLASLLECHNL